MPPVIFGLEIASKTIKNGSSNGGLDPLIQKNTDHKKSVILTSSWFVEITSVSRFFSMDSQ